MTDSISFGILTLGKGTVLWDEVIGSVMGVLLGEPFRCSLHRFLHKSSEILGVLQGTEGLVLKMRHSMQVFHVGRQQSG